jgi:hypothetical protein
MPTPAHRPAVLQWRVFLGTEARRQGLITAAQLRSTAWTRLRHDVYADARLERDHELACRAVALGLPRSTAIAGPSAAYLHGVAHAAEPYSDVHVIIPPPGRLSPRRGVIVHTTPLHRGDVTALGDLPVTSPMRTAWDVALWSDQVTAVAIIDGLLAGGLVDAATLIARARRLQGERGSRRAAEAFALADAGAQSPQESRVRVRLVLAGLPAPVTQHPIRLPSGVTVHPDLAWPEFRVAVEYDGQWHADPDRLHADRRRLNGLVAAGWIVLHVTTERMRRDFAGFAREVRTALVARGWKR